jgi:molecular chaperone DnaJ
MILPDHYRTLYVPASATAEDIKKSFRKLAQKYHPDKNSDDALSTEKFSAIQEAYYTLSDSKRRAAYNYARYIENPKRSVRQPVHTPEDIRFLGRKLAKEIALADPYRIDRDLLCFQLMDILSNDHLQILHLVNNTAVNREIVEEIVKASHPLPFNKLGEIIQQLEQLAMNDKTAEERLKQFIDAAKQQYYWNRYKVYIALAIAALACLLILLSGRK